MELRVLRYFLAAAREKSITGAAEALHVTQPTLSRQLMELEEELGKKLLIRGNRQLTLTDEGLLLRKRAEEIIELVQKAENEVSAADETLSGDIYIGGGETDAMRIIARTAKRLQEEYPQIRYHLFSGNAEDVAERLDHGLLDFGVLIEPFNMKKYDFIRLPVTDHWGVLMRKDSSLASKEVIKPQDLIDLPLLCSRQTMVRNEISGWIGKDFEKLNIVTTYNLIFNASLMVEEGLGYALALDKLINTSGHNTLCFKPLEPKMEVGLDIVWKKYQVFSRATEVFIDRLQEDILAIQQTENPIK